MFVGIIKGELTRFVRTSTNLSDYIKRASLFKEKLLLRGYGESEFEYAFSQVNHGDRQLYLNMTKRKDLTPPLVCVTKYNPHLQFLRKALVENWDIIENSSTLKQIFQNKPMIAYKRETNLRDSLVRAKLSKIPQSNSVESLLDILKKDKDSGLV